MLKSLIIKLFGYGLIFCLVFPLMISIDWGQKIHEEEIIPNFRYYNDRQERKVEFFNFLRPIAREENSRILRQRTRLHKLIVKKQRTGQLTPKDIEWLKYMALQYRIKLDNKPIEEHWELFKRRIDFIPTELILVQSANESAWGTSRFATKGNAMFGQLNFSKVKKGMVPLRRRPDDKYTVAKYESVRLSVRSYLRNLNTHSAYKTLRDLRYRARKKGKIPNAYELTPGLLYYSERRQAYVKEIQRMLIANKHLMGVFTP